MDQNEKPTIVMVDDDITILKMGSTILSKAYNVATIPSGEKLFALLQKVSPNLILLDVAMPGMDGYSILRELKSKRETNSIPVIFLTSRHDPESELAGLNLGAVDYIMKPLSPPLLLKRIELHLLEKEHQRILQNYNHDLREMVQEKTQTVMELQSSILKTVAELVEYRDETTGSHVERTKQYLAVLLDAMVKQNLYFGEISSWDKEFLLQSSQLHDLGKISVRDNVLLKPGKLTDEEFAEMKQHTVFGVKIIEEMEQYTPENNFLRYAKIFAGTHHEKWDGSGYPKGLSGTSIPLQGRLMAIADVYDALISARPYKPPLSHGESERIILEGKGKHFDPAIVDIFVQVSARFQAISDKQRTAFRTIARISAA